ncbi:integumentary mucin C.1-like isoform X1 [Pseudophryne corroboree]|uniref:integumentary mucin C.1-like isoform X1 n=1 Tax=Pseudophryne corroboree TaxID=495146 RepID=UPI0030815FB3
MHCSISYVLVLCALLHPSEQQCSVHIKEREDCGFPGISAMECYSRGCCFNSGVPGVKWCFYPKSTASDKKQCNVEPYSRRDCGYPTISAAECKRRSCCFDSSIPGVNWCFFSKSQDKWQCNVDIKEREDCGFPGISAKECFSRGCCFNSSVTGVKWCFYPKSTASNKQCNVEPYSRRDCGYPTISAAECKKKNCCFDSSIPGVNWCFFSKSQDKRQCSVAIKEREDCGFPGISAKECYSRGCCFNSSVTGVKWCFYPKSTDILQCSVDIQEREDCGFPGISAKECYSRGCCFNANVPGVIWCFYPKSTASASDSSTVLPPVASEGSRPYMETIPVGGVDSISTTAKLTDLFGTASPSGSDKLQCSVDIEEREDCGFPGISTEECYSRGCCFDSSVPGAKWCFYPKITVSSSDLSPVPPTPASEGSIQHMETIPVERVDFIPATAQLTDTFGTAGPSGSDKQQCSVDIKEREDCGFPGISAQECYSRRCCFDSSVPGAKWCFYPKNTGCTVSHELRKDCGYPNISSMDCLSRGCCFDSSIPGTIWCFYGYK